MSLSTSQIFSKLNILDAEVTLYRDKGSWRDDDERWGCAITMSHDGTELKVKGLASSGDGALHAAFEKLDAMLNGSSVAKALNLPLLESA